MRESITRVYVTLDTEKKNKYLDVSCAGESSLPGSTLKVVHNLVIFGSIARLIISRGSPKVFVGYKHFKIDASSERYFVLHFLEKIKNNRFFPVRLWFEICSNVF